jgi:hypothetical protein
MAWSYPTGLFGGPEQHSFSKAGLFSLYIISHRMVVAGVGQRCGHG